MNLEARLRLPKYSESFPGQITLVGFVDTGAVTLNKNPWPASAVPNHRTLSAAGFGATWVDYNNFSLSAYWAHKLGNAAATSVPSSVDSKSRVWLQGIKYF